jgi:hypothetical protein
MLSSKQILPFHYGVSVSLTALGTGTGTITFQQDFPFEFHYFMARTNLAGDLASSATQPHPDRFSVMVTEQTTGRQLMNQKVHQACLAGPSNESLPQRRPMIFPAGTVITTEFTEVSNNAIVVDFYMIGFKLLDKRLWPKF